MNSNSPLSSLPPDDLRRNLIIARPDQDVNLPHVGVVGDTYTILLSGADTAGRYCLVDMFIPPGGGPPSHRHDFEETFTVLEGEVEATFRGQTSVLKKGESLHLPANAPHHFLNASREPARLLCICSPAGLEEFFRIIGVPVATRTTMPPPPDPVTAKASQARIAELLPEYRMEILHA